VFVGLRKARANSFDDGAGIGGGDLKMAAQLQDALAHSGDPTPSFLPPLHSAPFDGRRAAGDAGGILIPSKSAYRPLRRL
jgi:hypothetical protein